MKSAFRFLASGAGRLTRIAAGLGLILWGIFYPEGTNWILIIIGLVPLAAGIFDFCVFAPLFGYPFSGPKLRAALNSNPEPPKS